MFVIQLLQSCLYAELQYKNMKFSNWFALHSFDGYQNVTTEFDLYVNIFLVDIDSEETDA